MSSSTAQEAPSAPPEGPTEGDGPSRLDSARELLGRVPGAVWIAGIALLFILLQHHPYPSYDYAFALSTGQDIWNSRDLGYSIEGVQTPLPHPLTIVISMFAAALGAVTSDPVATWTMALISVAAYSRYIRSSMLEVMNQDYVRTARAKGLHGRAVIVRHGLRNAALPIITVIGLDIPLLLGGAVVTERIFAWPGTGRLFLDHVSRADVTVVMGILMMIAVAVIVFQLLVDITYAWLDPRIRY